MSKLTKFSKKLNDMHADLLAEITTMINCPTAEDKAVIGSSAAFGAIVGGSALAFAKGDKAASGLDGTNDIFDKTRDMLSTIFGKLVGISTAVAVVMLIIVGILYMISSDPQSAQMAKKRAFRVIVAWILCNIIGSIVALVSTLTGEDKVDTVWSQVKD